MKSVFIHVCFSLLLLLPVLPLSAQIVGTNLFLQGAYLEAGFQQNGAIGAGAAAPSGYHPHGTYTVCGATGSFLGSVYDYGHDGWSVGTPPYMGDYSLPGSPFEEWDIQVSGNVYMSGATMCSGTAGLSSSFTSYNNVAGAATATWAGAIASLGLAIKQDIRIDTFGSAIVFKVTLYNNSAVPLTDIYFTREVDADNNASWAGGSYTTRNGIAYQNNAAHKVMATAYSIGTAAATGTPVTSLSLAAIDSRAKAIVYTAWPPALDSGHNFARIYADSPGTSYGLYDTSAGFSDTGLLIGIIFKIGTLAAGDSASFTYAYVYNGIDGIDSIVTPPSLVIDSVPEPSPFTVAPCTYRGVVNLPVSIANSPLTTTWSWAPSTALSGTTGLSQTVNRAALTAPVTYTLTGTDTIVGPSTLYVTIDPTSFTGAITGPSVVCTGATATLADTSAGGSWSSSSSALATVSGGGVVTGIDTGLVTITYIHTGACGADTMTSAMAVQTIPLAAPVTGIDSVCPGNTITLTDAATGGTWSSADATIATVSSTGVVYGVASGTVAIRYRLANTCGADSATMNVQVRPEAACATAASQVAPVADELIISSSGHGSFSITLRTALQAECTATITNLPGQKIQEFKLKTNEPTLLNLNAPGGIYLISTTLNGLRMVKRMVLE